MKYAVFIVVFSISLLADSLGAMEPAESEYFVAALTYRALDVSLQKAARDSEDYKKLIILKDVLFPTSLERSHLIAVHARAAMLGTIEIRSCGAVIRFSNTGDIYAMLLGFFDCSLDSEAEKKLRNDFCAALKNVAGLKQL